MAQAGGHPVAGSRAAALVDAAGRGRIRRGAGMLFLQTLATSAIAGSQVVGCTVRLGRSRGQQRVPPLTV